jgi:hypothetical protein
LTVARLVQGALERRFLLPQDLGPRAQRVVLASDFFFDALRWTFGRIIFAQAATTMRAMEAGFGFYLITNAVSVIPSQHLAVRSAIRIAGPEAGRAGSLSAYWQVMSMLDRVLFSGAVVL